MVSKASACVDPVLISFASATIPCSFNMRDAIAMRLKMFQFFQMSPSGLILSMMSVSHAMVHPA